MYKADDRFLHKDSTHRIPRNTVGARAPHILVVSSPYATLQCYPVRVMAKYTEACEVICRCPSERAAHGRRQPLKRTATAPMAHLSATPFGSARERCRNHCIGDISSHFAFAGLTARCLSEASFTSSTARSLTLRMHSVYTSHVDLASLPRGTGAVLCSLGVLN